MAFADEVAVITGAGSGIGRTTALAFTDRGANVVVADVDTEAGEETVRRIEQDGGDARFVATDVTDPVDAKSMVDVAIDEFGRLDYAFNNAGVDGAQRPVAEYNPDEWHNVVNVNLGGVFNCLRFELARMQELGNGGVIVNNSSIYGRFGAESSSAYAAAKHGVLGLTKSAAIENGEAGIRVNAVCPGHVETPLLEDAGITDDPEQRTELESQYALNRLGTPKEVASAVVWLCEDDASFVTGEAIGVHGGYPSP